MATSKKTRMKTAAVTVAVPQSRSMCADQIRQLGDLQREHTRAAASLNDSIAALANAAEPVLADLVQRIDALQTGIQVWCEANRLMLCGDADRLGKTANMVTGEVSWRIRPPSVSIRGTESVIEALRRAGLEQFVRTKEEPNKEAILNEPDAVAGIAGITVVRGVEDFVITPFEAKTEVSA
jgi:phage host-nuclease inhibitor protein Gam